MKCGAILERLRRWMKRPVLYKARQALPLVGKEDAHAHGHEHDDEHEDVRSEVAGAYG
jgi:hypothetical protein